MIQMCVQYNYYQLMDNIIYWGEHKCEGIFKSGYRKDQKCENTAYGWDLAEYFEGSNYIEPTQHSSSSLPSDPIWLLKKYSSSPAKYLTTLNTTQNSSAQAAYNANYGYQKFFTAQTSYDKQKWRFEFSLFTIT